MAVPRVHFQPSVLGGFLALSLLCGSPATSRADDPDPKAEEFFEAKVRPILVNSCVKCHGPEKSSGGLRLDSRAALLKGGDSGPAIISGKPDASLLVKAVRREKDVEAMPPEKPLAPDAVKILAQWVRDGAAWPNNSATIRSAKHWAFEPIRQVEPPPGIAGHPIDAFILTKLREKGLKPLGPAEKIQLIRRASFDLTGLPPSPEQLAAFLDDSSPRAWETVIDRLLASKHYGEKWGRQWLDVVRYADTAGETADFPVPDAWRYRNYVIDSFNSGKPFDQFVREQLAGDILANRLPPDAAESRYAELITATGYIALSRRFGYDPKKDHFLTIEDTIDTTGKAFLGLTIACARCHDHKYDPVSASDYYALYGIFESTRYPYPGAELDKKPRDFVPLLTPARRVTITEALSGATGLPISRHPVAAGPFAYAVWEGSPHDAQLHKRGDPDNRGDAVPRRFLKVLGGQPLPPGSGSGRLELADWLTDPKNPLTARVVVNRIWQGHFGTGLVATPNDFGTRGNPPTHPELLDWLAARFVKDGWSFKAMHRLIMLSDTYRRATTLDVQAMKSDPGNSNLWRFSRRRLSAEETRDAMLAVSGDLDITSGGPHPFPEQKTWGFTQHNPFKAVYDTNRRSVYLMTQRIQRHPFLALFDGPDPNSSTATRPITTVPTQALYFLNDPFVHARAESLAVKLLALPSDDARIDRACRLLYGRPAGDADRRVMTQLVGDRTNRKDAWAALIRVMFASNEFNYVE